MEPTVTQNKETPPVDLAPNTVPVQKWGERVVSTGGLKPTQRGIRPISEDMVSPNYTPSVTGWKISSAGDVEFNNAYIRGTLVIGGEYRTVEAGGDIQAAIELVHTAGGGVVVLQNGTYVLTSDITMYSNVYLQGQSRDLCVLYFVDNTHGIMMKGSNAYTAGTVDVTHGGTTVTGTSTTFTSAMVGRDILLQGAWYPISAFTDTTHVTIGIPYAGSTLTGSTYTIATTISDSRVNDVLISTASYGIDMQYAKDCYLTNLVAVASAVGYRMQTSANCQIINDRTVACASGAELTSCSLMSIEQLGVIDSSAGNGLTMTSCLNISITKVYSLGNSGDGINITSCQDISIDGVVKNNGGQGIELVSGNNNVIVNGSAVENNTSDGIKLTATSDNCFVATCSIANNGGWGINVAAATDDTNIILGNNLAGNSSGQVTDSGTSTKIRSNIGVADN